MILLSFTVYESSGSSKVPDSVPRDVIFSECVSALLATVLLVVQVLDIGPHMLSQDLVTVLICTASTVFLREEGFILVLTVENIEISNFHPSTTNFIS